MSLLKTFKKSIEPPGQLLYLKTYFLEKLKGLKIGGLTIIDGSTEHKFGDPDAKLHADC